MNQLIKLLPYLALLCVCMGITQNAIAQDPPASKKDGKSDLTEGLMDLLREPSKSLTPGAADTKPPSPAKPTETMDGEDIGQGPSNPLAEVQLGMSTLAEWLRNRSDVTRTKDLQRDVVLRLDELIVQLEQQSQSASQSNASSSSSSQRAPASQNQSSSASSSETSPSSASADSAQSQSDQKPTESSQQGDENRKPGQDNASQNPSPSPNQPGQTGDGDPQPGPGQPGVSSLRSRSVTVDLNDPRALQRSAWGNLPERTREQMQSRMVERFLPPYRDEIEAYYRALAK